MLTKVSRAIALIIDESALGARKSGTLTAALRRPGIRKIGKRDNCVV